jgi:hypothetical protein
VSEPVSATRISSEDLAPGSWPKPESGGWKNKPPARAEKPVLKKFWEVEKKNFKVHFCEISGRFLPLLRCEPSVPFFALQMAIFRFPGWFPGKKVPCN